TPRSSSKIWIGAGVAGILLIVGIFALSSGGSPPSPPPHSSPPGPPPPPPSSSSSAPSPSPGTPPPAEVIKDAVLKAQEFTRQEPENFPGQQQLWDQAAKLAERTPFASDVQFELGKLKARRAEAVAKRMQAIDQKTAPLLASESFQAALD